MTISPSQNRRSRKLYALRYYCQDEAFWQRWKEQDPSRFAEHQETLNWLQRVHAAHDIPYEVVTVPSHAEGWTDDAVEEKFYREHIVPRTHLLLPRLEVPTLRRAFRSRSGNLHLIGTVAIIENGEVGWATGTPASRHH